MASKPILYSYFRSSASWRVRIVLAMKGIDYEYKSVHLVKDGGQQNTEEYKALNPMGQVPVLQVQDTSLSQSLAIIDYLEDVYPEPSITPKDPLLKAQARALGELIASGTQPIQNLAVLQKVSDNPEGRAEWGRFWVDRGFAGTRQHGAQQITGARGLAELITAGTQPLVSNRVRNKLSSMGEPGTMEDWGQFWIDRGLQAYEKLVQKTAGKYSVGDNVTIADICLVPQLYNANRFKVDMSKFPTVTRIISALSELDAFKAAHPHAQPDCPEELRGTT